tara:strand:- start:969 stop:1223 length:255 start_codon:yes stop_codon:yes gene_type:complete
MTRENKEEKLQYIKGRNNCVAITTNTYTYKGEIKITKYKKTDNSIPYVLLYEGPFCIVCSDLNGKDEKHISYDDIVNIEEIEDV